MQLIMLGIISGLPLNTALREKEARQWRRRRETSEAGGEWVTANTLHGKSGFLPP